MRHGRSPQPTTIILNLTLIACTGGASAASGPSSTGGRNSTWISKLVLLQLFMLFQGPGLKKNRRNSTRNSNLLFRGRSSYYVKPRSYSHRSSWAQQLPFECACCW